MYVCTAADLVPLQIFDENQGYRSGEEVGVQLHAVPRDSVRVHGETGLRHGGHGGRGEISTPIV